MQTTINNLPRNILLIRLSAMGDVAMTVPVLKSLTNQFPETKITVLSRPFFEPIFNGLPNVSFKAVDLKNKHKGLSGIFNLFFELRKHQFDAVADLHGVLRSHLLRNLFRLSGKQVAQIDKGRADKKALTRSEDKIFKQLKTTPERYADVFRKLGFELELEAIEKPYDRQHPPRLPTSSGILPSKEGIKNHRIGIAPFAQHAAKQYPLEVMEQAVKKLAKKNKIYLFGGGEKEKTFLENWATKYNKVESTVGKQTFAEELALISSLDLMISMDSGNGHLAANYGVNVLTIWGLTHPFAGFAPFGSSEKNWLLPDLQKYPNIPTSVYGNNIPKGYENAMESISPEQIIEKVNELLAE